MKKGATLRSPTTTRAHANGDSIASSYYGSRSAPTQAHAAINACSFGVESENCKWEKCERNIVSSNFAVPMRWGCYVCCEARTCLCEVHPGKGCICLAARMSPSALEATIHIANTEGEREETQQKTSGLSVDHTGRNLRKPVSRRPAMRDTTKQKKMAPANPPIWYASLSASSPGVMALDQCWGKDKRGR